MAGTVKQEDIARHLGISRSMVARALGDDTRISPVSRRRVREAARRLGYDPEANHSARYLIAGRYGRKAATKIIGCLFLQLSDHPEYREPAPYTNQLLHGIRLAAHRAGMDILLANPIRSLSGSKVDGLLCFGDDRGRLAHEYYADSPLVMMMCRQPDALCVAADDGEGIRQAVRHLVELGHRRIAYLSEEGFADEADRTRQIAYRDALRSAGIESCDDWIYFQHGPGQFCERAKASMARWLRAGFRDLGCTALLTHNDSSAGGVIQALQEAGISVPRDISLVGFDSTEECEHLAPRLTSVRVPLREIGETAVELLMRKINGDSRTLESIVFPTQLDIRDSTAPLLI